MDSVGQIDVEQRHRPNVERRLIGRFISYWREACDDQSVPQYGRVMDGPPLEFMPHFFLAEVDAHSGTCKVLRVGDLAGKVLGGPTEGRALDDMLPSGVNHQLRLCETVASYGKPVADAGQCTSQDGQEILYRAAIVPLANGRGDVSHVLGAVNFKYLN